MTHISDVKQETRPLRVAVVGAGKMGAQHVRAIRALGESARLVGVIDSSAAAREAVLDAAPGAIGEARLDALMAGTPVDVIHVCTPMETHAAVAQEALELGAHVYIEKPVTTSVRELEPLLEAADRRGLRVCAGHQVLFERPYLRLCELLPRLGTPVHVESYFSFRPVRTSAGRGRPLTQAEQLVDVLPHPTYLLLDLLERVQGSAPVGIGALELSHDGTVHGLIRKGELRGSLVVSLEGRPVEHWLRVVGTNGTVHADFVRGAVHELLGPGSSGIDKALNPFRLAAQTGLRSAAVLARRVAKRGGSYPGLEGIFSSFYDAVREGEPSPTSTDQIRGTVEVCEAVARLLRDAEDEPGDGGWTGPAAEVAVTGGTGLLGRDVVRALTAAGRGVRVIARRVPPARKRVPGVEYVAADLAAGLAPEHLAGIRAVIHCAAETAGGRDAHQRNSIDATEHLVRAAAAAGVDTFVHVSSVAVLEPERRRPVRDVSPLWRDPESRGPYVWGKLESERAARSLAAELGLRLRVVRPAPLVDWRAFDPPGRLGRRVGNLYVAVGRPAEPLVLADTEGSARAVVTAALRPDDVPEVMNLVPERPPTRRELVHRLKETSPEVRVVWLPRIVLHPLSWAALLAQKVLRPRSPAIRLASAFAAQDYEPGPAARLMAAESPPGPGSAVPPATNGPPGGSCQRARGSATTG